MSAADMLDELELPAAQVIVGVDPGQAGALAVMVDGDVVAVHDMPVVDKWVSPALLHELRARIVDEHGRIDLAVVEFVRSMPRQGVSSSFKFGAAWGMAVATFADVPLEQPRPTAWKRQLGISGSDKERSRALALDRWPHLADQLKRKKDADRAEAALLCEYGRQARA